MVSPVMPRSLLILCPLLALNPAAISGADLAGLIRALDSHVLPATNRAALADLVRADQRRRLQLANDASSAAWRAVQDRAAWEALRKPRLAALRSSLGTLTERVRSPRVKVTGVHAGEGFRVENLLIESRPGWWITANRYLPARSGSSMPGLLLSHSHHRPKEQGELQDMGMTWARAGCVVLVPDHPGHGERRQHPFATGADFPREFRPSRQDYYFRYDASLQLYLAGESLMGWIVGDLMRGVDVLLATPGVDANRIALLGAVAGGGDPAAVTAALDPRVSVAVPFNFGGPQPETRYPLPDDAETSFNYAGGGSWESTRNLHRSAADGFLPWVIVGGIAPRGLVFAHEFNWDQPRDPVWRRLQSIFSFYAAPDRLDHTHGHGEVRMSSAQASHCTNIGRQHRVRIHGALARWFGLRLTPADEYSRPLAEEDLRCWTPEARAELRPRPLRQVLGELMDQNRSHRPVDATGLRPRLAGVLGEVEPPRTRETQRARETLPGEFAAERTVLETDPGIVVPLLLLTPTTRAKPAGCVLAVAQSGKADFLKHRSDEVAELLAHGLAVCLPDLRGTGETRAGSGRDQDSADTSRSATELMLGGTMLGARLRDLRAVFRHLRQREDLRAGRFAVWGDSFAAVNEADTNFNVPRRVSGRPHQSEPAGALLALLLGVFEPDIHAIQARGGLSGFRSVLNDYQVWIPHDSVVPGILQVADVAGLAGALAPQPLALESFVDGRNQLLNAAGREDVFTTVREAYRKTDGTSRLRIAGETNAGWLLSALRAE